MTNTKKKTAHKAEHKPHVTTGGPKEAKPSKKAAATVAKQVQEESPEATGHNDI